MTSEGKGKMYGKKRICGRESEQGEAKGLRGSTGSREKEEA